MRKYNLPPTDNSENTTRKATYHFHTVDGRTLETQVDIPDEEHFPNEIKRLSRKLTRNGPYAKPEWNDILNKVIKTREMTVIANGTQYTVREIHDADQPPTESLLSVQLISQFNYSSDGQTILSTRYLDFSMKHGKILGHTVIEEPVGDNTLESTDLQGEADFQQAIGYNEIGDTQYVSLYTGLKSLANESFC